MYLLVCVCAVARNVRQTESICAKRFIYDLSESSLCHQHKEQLSFIYVRVCVCVWVNDCLCMQHNGNTLTHRLMSWILEISPTLARIQQRTKRCGETVAAQTMQPFKCNFELQQQRFWHNEIMRTMTTIVTMAAVTAVVAVVWASAKRCTIQATTSTTTTAKRSEGGLWTILKPSGWRWRQLWLSDMNATVNYAVITTTKTTTAGSQSNCRTSNNSDCLSHRLCGGEKWGKKSHRMGEFTLAIRNYDQPQTSQTAKKQLQKTTTTQAKEMIVSTLLERSGCNKSANWYICTMYTLF